MPGKADNGGDIYVKIKLAKHKIFSFNNYDLTRELKVKPWDAALGGDIQVETLFGNVTMKMPPGTQDGQRLRLRGKGLPKRGAKESGDLYVVIKIDIPRTLNAKQRDLWQELAKLN